ncbi:response regulator [Paenibacillus sp. PL2-23]|uniref:response regulator transcription factor n=1 Tax=Paenibacillus sp. PL2-23 TaxID=2100729 RepID=UPI0030FD0030
MEALKIMVVEDEKLTRNGIMRTLKDWDEHILCQASPNGLDAMQRLGDFDADIIITDIRMPGMDGLELIRQLKDSTFDPVCIVLTGYADFEYAKEALRNGASDYLLKPIDPDKLIQSIDEASKLVHERKTITLLRGNPNLMQYLQSESGEIRNEWIREALAYMTKNMAVSGLTLKEVADHVHMSPSYLSALFKQEVGTNFLDYLTEMRMKKARELLLFGPMKVYEIAEAVGYASTKYFVKVFHDREGITPKRFRDQNQ